MSEQEILDAPVRLVEYDAIQTGLAQLRKDLVGVQFDVTTTDGNKAARAARQRCVSIRTAADAAYTGWNKPMLEKQRAMRRRPALGLAGRNCIGNWSLRTPPFWADDGRTDYRTLT